MPDHANPILTHLINGLLFGIGLMVVLVIGGLFINVLPGMPLRVLLVDKEELAAADYREDLSIVSHVYLRERRTRNLLQVLGKVKNSGNVAWKGIEIQAELFHQGHYVDECNTFIKVLMPGEEDNVKILCGECGLDTLPEYDQIRLKVAGAHRE